MNGITRNVAAVRLIASAPLAGHAQVAWSRDQQQNRGCGAHELPPVGKEIRLGKRDTLALGYGMLVRDLKPRPQTALEPRVTICGVSPVIELKEGGALLIERLDQPGVRDEIAISASHLVHKAFYDLAHRGAPLTPGDIYRASAGTRQIIFKVDATAKPGAPPIISRLLRIQSGT